ncbi:MAG: type II toxin-antitoxin system VapC family toxin [Candidatus Limnocylindrales bacterium]|jgi:PIN domain nuclease of toxin-antitoxin system
MKLLLDTHVWIWLLADPDRLSRSAHAALVAADNQLYLSPASTWECSVKFTAGRLDLDGSPEALLQEAIVASGVLPLPIEHSHALQTARLPAHHRDPFDRMLIAQAQVERMTLVSADEQLTRYDVEILWS